jgi:serine/threonine protein kinase
VKVPAGYVVEAVISAGPTASVALGLALAPAPGERRECVLKVAAIERAIPLLANEASVLRALGEAGVAGVPRLLEAWRDGFAVERLRIPTLRELGALIRGQIRAANATSLADAVAERTFARLADVHAARDAWNVPLRVVHGDVSPDNVYVAPDGSSAVLADFGLARWRDGATATDAGGAFRGTLLYAAPEVARGEPFDARADDFALAASLLHVTSGIALRGGASGAGAASEAVMLVEAGTHALDASHPWRAFARTSFRPAIADALLACLAFDPRDRPRETPRPC